MQAYSDPRRENDPHALPDIEVWQHRCAHAAHDEHIETVEGSGVCAGSGWYWWSCFPGCLPDCDPVGPFATEAEALADAQEGAESDED